MLCDSIYITSRHDKIMLTNRPLLRGGKRLTTKGTRKLWEDGKNGLHYQNSGTYTFYACHQFEMYSWIKYVLILGSGVCDFVCYSLYYPGF